jgi:putative sterol carrier protein
MNIRIAALSGALIIFGFSATASAQTVLMSVDWAKQACDEWNKQPKLTDELAAPGWVANSKDRGYKVMQVYRTDCENSPRVELRISDKDGKALCEYGGKVETSELAGDADYIMHATTERWQQMGAGDYGPMKAMMFGRLKFEGPKWEAMKNMGPFGQFLLLAGVIPSDAETCPQ